MSICSIIKPYYGQKCKDCKFCECFSYGEGICSNPKSEFYNMLFAWNDAACNYYDI